MLIAIAALVALTAQAQEAANMLPNGSFVGDANADGLADDWDFAAGTASENLAVSFGLEELTPGRFAQRVTCTRYQAGHAMICQTGAVDLKGGQWYRITLRAKGDGVRQASVGIHDTDGWKEVSPFHDLSLGKRWRDISFKLRATHDCHETSRFQIWFTRVGTLWVSDVTLTPVEPDPPKNVLPATGCRNLLHNPSFEVPGGWGMVNHCDYGWTQAKGEGVDGETCAAIKWDPANADLGRTFDYFEMQRQPLLHPYLQAIGYVPIRGGETYTLSAWMRADRDSTPAILGLRGPGAWSSRKVSLTTEWQRFDVTTTAAGDLTLVQVGPDFAEADTERFGGCTVYLDNVQLEVGTQTTEFASRPLEVFTPHVLQTTSSTSPVTRAPTLTIHSDTPREADVTVSVVDISDSEVFHQTTREQLQQGVTTVTAQVALPGPGFYRVTVTVASGEDRAETSARWALCLAPPTQGDTAFGINHAYAYNQELRWAKALGISWVRDWSLKWEHVETQPGKFTFDDADFQIRRPQDLGVKVLCMFPFPSAEWSSTAPPELRTDQYPGVRIRQAFAPKDGAALSNYAEQCVRHYSATIPIWEVFNESIYTDYSLPQAHGYKAEDYVPLLKAVYEGCKRADPQCKVMGGYSAPPGMMPLYEAMFRAGGLEFCDLFSLHIYPGGAPEFLDDDLKRLNALMDQHGGRKPMWMTEYAYYADDDPEPIERGWPDLLASEQQQACWNTRACVMMLANGVEKVFYHIWTTQLNRDIGSAIFFEFAGAPRKIAPAQAAMSYFLGPRPKLIQQHGDPDEEQYAYTFEAPEYLRKRPDGKCTVSVMWIIGEGEQVDRYEAAEYYDICGRPIGDQWITVGEAPVYVVIHE